MKKIDYKKELKHLYKPSARKVEDNYPTTNVMNNRTDINDFNKIPNVGPATIRYLNIIGIKKPFELIGQNPYSMYGELCRITGKQFDPCLADIFISAVKFMEGAPPQKWWHYTEERKKRLTKQYLKAKDTHW